MCMCIHVHMYMCAYEDQKLISGFFFNLFQLYFLRHGYSVRLSQSIRLAGQ